MTHTTLIKAKMARERKRIRDTAGDMLEALKLIVEVRDCLAATGKPHSVLVEAGQEFDDWAADLADAVIAKAEGRQPATA